MICIIALVVFAILAIFSARYRPLAAEAFDCVFRRLTFRKCHSRLDKRLKSKITGKVMKRHPGFARFLYKYFEVLSWLFLILFLLSVVQVGISGYNYAVYGNCNGPDDSGFCILDPLNTNGPEISDTNLCTAGGVATNELTLPSLANISNNPKTGSASASVTVVEFGCYACPNTAKQAPAVKELIEYFGPQIQFVYVDFPLPTHPLSYESALAAQCVFEQDALLYWRYHFLLFEEQSSYSLENFASWAVQLGADGDMFESCMNNNITREIVDANIAVGTASGVYGTPTFFINDEPLVGVKSFKLLKARVNDALESAS